MPASVLNPINNCRGNFLRGGRVLTSKRRKRQSFPVSQIHGNRLSSRRVENGIQSWSAGSQAKTRIKNVGQASRSSQSIPCWTKKTAARATSGWLHVAGAGQAVCRSSPPPRSELAILPKVMGTHFVRKSPSSLRQLMPASSRGGTVSDLSGPRGLTVVDHFAFSLGKVRL
ncbi:hypothetical protein K461DRAFT_94057 [Myriangium duriaei CBS 260.36]|uniref:Uncharacterized protein n=1 Tax=Myriangium duriaei CBS 260.36 TaxID=1168546 RepID=A0A9P4JC53_9PEZI|nr:hypothetical protein K461DRAFT_94057 [Myriangium duriaei CBS 260.36]